MSHLHDTLLAVSTQVGESTDPSSAVSARWRLNRAGIVNVYQYQNEVLDFAGGRLLLRGVNGSGKSTAMNMLLPFLLTTRQGRIDAAGEQSEILKSWMLNGRDDAQPVGYLWIEFERQAEFLVCGCGIKASRSSNNVSTWWFITSKRPGVDIALVSGGVALSTEALRASLDGDEVFVQRRRRDYRRTIEQRLFGGASIDAHIELLNKVRSPRVGDRIDLDLRDHLVGALPQLSERALAEAAQPLDDLEEYRRRVAELTKTLEAVRGLLDVYRSYCLSDLRRRAEEGRRRLSVRSDCARDEKRKGRAADAAEADVKRLDAQTDELAKSERRLRREIEALEKSPAYREGQQLEGLRKHVLELAEQCERSAKRVFDSDERVREAAEALERAGKRGHSDVEDLNEDLATAAELGHRCGLDRRPPRPVALGESAVAGIEVGEPEAFDPVPVDREISAAVTAVGRRRSDIEQVEEALDAERAAEEGLRQAEWAHNHAIGATTRATERLAESNRLVSAARSEWIDQVRRWASLALGLFQAAGIKAPTTAAQARAAASTGDGGSVHDDADTGVSHTTPDDPEDLRTSLLSEASDLVEHWQGFLGSLKSRLAGEREAEREALQVVEDLSGRTEPDPPRLEWQSGAEHCLADLIDFAAHLDESQRAGLEAGLQASGLLSARPSDGTLELAGGELVVVVAGGVPNPLSEHLVVTVPQGLASEVEEGSILKLLDSISSDLSAGAATSVSLEGAFKVGSLRGRHTKERAEHIGATARRAALHKARAEAAQRLELASGVVERSLEERAECQASLETAKNQTSLLPATEAIIKALSDVGADAKTVDEAAALCDAARDTAAEAERFHSDASNALHRITTTLSLPRNGDGLDEVRSDLTEADSTLRQCRSRLAALRRSLNDWRDAIDRWRTAAGFCEAERADLARVQAKHDEEHSSLATIEDSIGAEYTEVVVIRDRCRAELDDVEKRIPQTRNERDSAVNRRADAGAAERASAQNRERAEGECETARNLLDEALSTRGYLAAFSENQVIAARSAGSEGLREMLDAMAPLLPVDQTETSAESVRQSLQRRRDSLGAGWDAEALHPDLAQPLMVEVTGPSGRAPLAEQVKAVSQQHQQVAGLLNRKQDDALRQLLQGLIAREIAEKIHGAKRLVDRTNERLDAVSTAHRVGARLRWRRSGELDAATQRMVDLLAKKPDLRTDGDQGELRQLLSRCLDEARADHPDLPYRQLIADALDYKQWHEMAVMVRRGSDETRLGRTTPLSEGEKKLVTYLPLFAAVAASCDALAEQQAAPAREGAGLARFVLLDDAFAKVSEDNHAALFGLLVDLDLDFIATSERLWGDHATVPELAITEVIRDAALGAILLENYRWDGFTLERQSTT